MNSKTNAFTEALNAGLRKTKGLLEPKAALTREDLMNSKLTMPSALDLARQQHVWQEEAYKREAESLARVRREALYPGLPFGAGSAAANNALGQALGAGHAFSPPAPPPDPNEIPAYSMSMKDLFMMFELKCNGRWLKRDDLRKDEFWGVGFNRLQQYNLLESSFDGHWVRARETL